MKHLIYFDRAPVPAIATEDLAYRPARDSLPWVILTDAGAFVDAYAGPRGPAKVYPFPQYVGPASALPIAA